MEVTEYNAKVSVFIPIDREDEQNPVIQQLYPTPNPLIQLLTEKDIIYYQKTQILIVM